MKRDAEEPHGNVASEKDPKLFAQDSLEEPFLKESLPMEETLSIKEEVLLLEKSPRNEETPPYEATPQDEETPLAVALKLLNSKDYTSQKLSEVLNTKGFSNREITECIARLQDWGYLNDREYGIRRLQILLKKLKSRLYVREDLILHGLPEGLVSGILEEHYPEEVEIQIAGKFLEKRSKIKRKSQIWGLRVLQQAGFSENTIHRCFPE